jgi:hypothetical protein
VKKLRASIKASRCAGSCLKGEGTVGCVGFSSLLDTHPERRPRGRGCGQVLIADAPMPNPCPCLNRLLASRRRPMMCRVDFCGLISCLKKQDSLQPFVSPSKRVSGELPAGSSRGNNTKNDSSEHFYINPPSKPSRLPLSSRLSDLHNSTMALDSFFHNKIESMKLEIIQGQAVLRRLEAQRNDYNSRGISTIDPITLKRPN